MTFVTVRIFELPSDLLIARGVLEANGIECQTKDELTVQVDNFLSNAIGGVKLQVKEEDVLIANQLLNEGGFLEGKKAELNSAEKIFSNEKFQKNLKRLGILLSLILLLVFAFVVYAKANFSYEKHLISNVWYLDYVKKGDLYHKPFFSNNYQFQPIIKYTPNFYYEATFLKNGQVDFPPFQEDQRNHTEVQRVLHFNPIDFPPKFKIDEKNAQITLSSTLPSKFELYEKSLNDLKEKQNLTDSEVMEIKGSFHEKLEAGILPFPEYTFIDNLLPLTLDIIKDGNVLKFQSDSIEFHFNRH